MKSCFPQEHDVCLKHGPGVVQGDSLLLNSAFPDITKSVSNEPHHWQAEIVIKTEVKKDDLLWSKIWNLTTNQLKEPLVHTIVVATIKESMDNVTDDVTVAESTNGTGSAWKDPAESLLCWMEIVNHFP